MARVDAPVYHILGDYDWVAQHPEQLAALARLHALALRGFADCASDESDEEDEGLLVHVAEAVAYRLRLMVRAPKASTAPPDPGASPDARRLHAVEKGGA